MQKHDINVSVLPNGKHLAGFAFWGNEHDIVSAYLNKLDKLNSTHFKRYKENNLFIFAWMIEKDDIEHEISKIVEQNQRDHECISYKFDDIYIFTGDILYCITLKNTTSLRRQ